MALKGLISTAAAARLRVENQSDLGRCRDLALPPPPRVFVLSLLLRLRLRLGLTCGDGAADGLSSRRKQHLACARMTVRPLP